MASQDYIWTLNGPVPRNWWEGNRFMMPSLAMPARAPAPTLPQIDKSGALTTTNAVANAPFVTEGTGRNQGPGEAGLGRGPADIGYSKGGATADTTTTATDSTKDFAKSGLVGLGLMAGGFPAAIAAGSYALTGQTPMSYGLSQLASALGFGGSPETTAPNPNQPGLGTALVGQANDPFGGGTGLGVGASQPGVDLVGQANDPYGGGTGLGQGGDQGSAK